MEAKPGAEKRQCLLQGKWHSAEQGWGGQGAPVSCHGVNGAPSRCLAGSAGQTGCFNILGLACPALDKEELEADRGALSTLFPGAISNKRTKI